MIALESRVSLLDDWLNQISGCFTAETAKALASLPPHQAIRARMVELGEKASNGTLSEEEAREYDSYIEVGDLVSVLQLKARERIAASR